MKGDLTIINYNKKCNQLILISLLSFYSRHIRFKCMYVYQSAQTLVTKCAQERRHVREMGENFCAPCPIVRSCDTTTTRSEPTLAAFLTGSAEVGMPHRIQPLASTQPSRRAPPNGCCKSQEAIIRSSERADSTMGRFMYAVNGKITAKLLPVVLYPGHGAQKWHSTICSTRRRHCYE